MFKSHRLLEEGCVIFRWGMLLLKELSVGWLFLKKRQMGVYLKRRKNKFIDRSVRQERRRLRDRMSDDRNAQDLFKGFLENVTIEKLTS